MLKTVTLFIILVLFNSYSYARVTDYNFISNTKESFIYPFDVKNSVSTYEELYLLKGNTDGDIRLVTSTNKTYQFNKSNNAWLEITSPSSNISFFYLKSKSSLSLVEELFDYSDGTFEILEDGSITILNTPSSSLFFELDEYNNIQPKEVL